MAEHSIFYYPYASLGAEQTPLLRAAALYFDKLYLLDPLKASWGGVGLAPNDEAEIRLLEREGILERIAPEEVLHRFEEPLAESIRRDLQDPGFVQLCEEEAQGRRWTLALAKVPRAIREDPQLKPLDRSMQRVLGGTARSLAAGAGAYQEMFLEYAGTGQVYDEYAETLEGAVEYRYADYPLALGESIMLNHALFAGLAHAAATPLTDHPFHNRVLAYKIERARQIPEVRRVLEDRARKRQLRTDQLALGALTDLDLALLPAEIPLEEVLEYRRKHSAELEQARQRLRWLAREIREEPWSPEFAETLEHDTIPRVHAELQAAREATSRSMRDWLKAAAFGVSATAAVISLTVGATPLLPLAVVGGALTLAGDVMIPGAEIALDWRDGKRTAAANGMHYFLKLKR